MQHQLKVTMLIDGLPILRNVAVNTGPLNRLMGIIAILIFESLRPIYE